MARADSSPLMAVAGAGGFVGKRLVLRLAREGVAIRALMRRRAAPIANEAVVSFDLADPTVIKGAALEGVQTAYYLVHAMSEGANFAAVSGSAGDAITCRLLCGGGSRDFGRMDRAPARRQHLVSRPPAR
jgi:putative NADH-flavin reductase